MRKEDVVLKKEITFKVAISDQDLSYSLYTLLRLACYPLANQSAKDINKYKSYVVSFRVTEDGVLKDILEQRQLDITDINACDLNLVKYYLQDAEYDNGDDESTLSFMRDNGPVTVKELKVELAAWEYTES